MSYCASAYSSFRLKDDIDPNVLQDLEDDNFGCNSLTCTILEGNKYLSVEHDGRYDEWDVYKDLEHLLEYLCTDRGTKIYMDFVGEDDSHWRMLLDDHGVWRELEGRVVYDKLTGYERLLQIFQTYVLNDAETADLGYIRDVLRDICMMTKEEADELGLGNLFAEDE